jgi:hypothetical protein
LSLHFFFEGLYFIYLFIVVLGVHCGIYKSSYNIANIKSNGFSIEISMAKLSQKIIYLDTKFKVIFQKSRNIKTCGYEANFKKVLPMSNCSDSAES